MRATSRDVKKLESGALSVVQEVLTGLRVVKAFGQEDREQDRFVGRSTAGMRARIRLALIEGGYAMLVGTIIAAGGSIQFNSDPAPGDLDGIVIDCRGLAARDSQPELRGVKGEMIIVETSEVELSRPVRLIHPRWPLYVIPRGDGKFMLGATSIEAEDTGVSVRSALELLGAAYAVHPAFAEARIVEFGSGLRPAFPDNLPRITVGKNKIAVNGLYRHGFLLAPALAELTLGFVQRGAIDNEVMRCV